MKNIGTKRIETERLILRKIALKDAQPLCELLNDKDVQDYLAGIPSNYTYEMAVDYIGQVLAKKYKDRHFYDWGIIEKASNTLVGRICVYRQDEDRRMADLVWYMFPSVRGKGYTTEAALAVVKLLQSLGYERIEAFANVDNVASHRVMEKIGMKYEGTLKKYDQRRDGTLYDAKMYAITEKCGKQIKFRSKL